jgi:hypothetical protein
VTTRLAPIDNRQFQQLIEKIGLYKHISSLAYQHTNSKDPVLVHLSETNVAKDIMKSIFKMFPHSEPDRINFPDFVTGLSIILKGTTAEKATSRNSTKYLHPIIFR